MPWSAFRHFFFIIFFFFLTIYPSLYLSLSNRESAINGKESTLILVTRLLIIASQLAPHGGPYTISTEQDGNVPTDIIRTKINFRCPKLRKSIAPIDLPFSSRNMPCLPSSFLELIRRFQLLCNC